MSMAAVSAGAVWLSSRSRTASRHASTSASAFGNGATNTPDGSGAWPARYTVFDVVIAMARWVRPWKLPWNTITFGRPVACLASFTADSVASAPELAKKNVSTGGGAMAASRPASSAEAGVAVHVDLGVDEPRRLRLDGRDHVRVAVARCS